MPASLSFPTDRWSTVDEHIERILESITPLPPYDQPLLEALDQYEVHVIVTVRGLAGFAPSAWQQHVKARGLKTLHEYLEDLAGMGSGRPAASVSWPGRASSTGTSGRTSCGGGGRTACMEPCGCSVRRRASRAMDEARGPDLASGGPGRRQALVARDAFFTAWDDVWGEVIVTSLRRNVSR